MEGDADLLIDQGKVQEARLKRELITLAELTAAARRQGIEGLHEVQTCRLEVGALTLVPRAPTEDEQRHRELLQQLADLRERQSSVLARLGELERRRQASPSVCTRPSSTHRRPAWQ